MKTIQDIIRHNNLSIVSGNPAKQAPNLRQEITSSNTEKYDESLEVINRVFLRLAAVYGNPWRNMYKGNDFLQFTKLEWLEGLSGYDELTLYQAIGISRDTLKFPPTLPEFIECCKHIKKERSGCYKSEQVKPASPTIAEANLAKMKEILTMTSH